MKTEKVADQDEIPILVGPTGTGKTVVAIELARSLKADVISADSRQLFRSLSIGTSKPKGKWVHKEKHPIPHYYEVEGIPHHLMDCLDPTEGFNAGLFSAEASGFLETLREKNKRAVVVGGTGLYLRCLVDGMAPMPKRDEVLRKALSALAERDGREALHQELSRVDPKAAKKIPPNNIARLIRALEVYLLTGRTISWWQTKKTKPSPFPFRWFGLKWDKSVLEKQLMQRCCQMLKNGLLEETKNLLKEGVSKESLCFQSLGYRQAISYLEGKITKKDLQEKFYRETRLYAKRQMTWFRADTRIQWIDVKNYPFNSEEVAKKILSFL